MEQLLDFGDERQTACCAYCGGPTQSKDHVPSKVFLDEPYPSQLPTVPACQSCNNGFSVDEEYVACLVECALAGTTDPEGIRREKVRRIQREKPALASRLAQACKTSGDSVTFNVETQRVKNVVVKLGRGHAAFELDEPQLNPPSVIAFKPLHLLTPAEAERFESPINVHVFPEVGSRAMQRLLAVGNTATADWVEVQAGRYRYLAGVDGGVIVRVVIGEYLACEMAWRHGTP